MSKVRAICISEKKGTAKVKVPKAEFIEDFGIKGDAHAGKWHRQVSRTESKLPQANQCGKMWLRLRNDANVLSAWYSADGKKWHKYPWGFEISGVHHNTVYGFLFVRPGIFAGGDGQVEVTDFVLRNLD